MEYGMNCHLKKVIIDISFLSKCIHQEGKQLVHFRDKVEHFLFVRSDKLVQTQTQFEYLL